MDSRPFILLTNQYLPNPGATGVCVHKIAKELVKRGHQVTVVCYDDNCSDTSCIEGIDIVRIKIPFYLKNLQNFSKITRLFAKFSSLFCKLFNIYRYPFRSALLKRGYIHALKEIVGNEKDCVILASYTPIEAVVALTDFKKHNQSVFSVYYSTDTLSNEHGNSGFLSPDRRERMGYKWECKMFSVYDMILIMQCHRAHYFTSKYSRYLDKMRLVNFPLFVINNVRQTNGVLTNNATRKIVFAGTMYKALRNPGFACELFSKLVKDSDIHLVFIGGGDCEDVLLEAEKNSGGSISYLGFKPYSTAFKYVNDSDILLSIGNAGSDMMPSKIYEYMSTGKPIVHIYSYDNDPCINVLKVYGNSMLIKEGDFSCTKALLSFINNAKTIDCDTVFAKFKTSMPSYTADILEAIL